jgi:hypothetical protein
MPRGIRAGAGESVRVAAAASGGRGRSGFLLIAAVGGVGGGRPTGRHGRPALPRFFRPQAVEGILQGMHALGPGEREQPAGDDPFPLRKLDAAHGTAHVDVEVCPRVDRPRPRPRLGRRRGVGRSRPIGEQPPVRERDKALRKPQVGVEVEPAGGEQRLTILERDGTGPRQPTLLRGTGGRTATIGLD